MEPASLFQDLVKEYLFLSLEQNERLTRPIMLEKILYHHKKAKVVKNLRIDERPGILSLVELTRLM